MKGNKPPSEHRVNVRVGECNFLQGVQKPIVELSNQQGLCKLTGSVPFDFDCSFAIPWLLFCCSKHSWVSHACYILQPLCQMLLQRSAVISRVLRMSHLYKFCHDQAFVMARSEPLPRWAGLFRRRVGLDALSRKIAKQSGCAAAGRCTYWCAADRFGASQCSSGSRAVFLVYI